MSRSWIQGLRLLAVAGLAALPAVVWSQDPAPTAAPALATPAEAAVPVQALVAGQADVFALAATVPSPQGEFNLLLASPAQPALPLFGFTPQAAQLHWIAQGQEPGAGTFFYTQGAAPPAEARLRITKAAPDESAAAPDYWIGVQLEPLPEIVTSQLKLERGMVVVQVFDNSPAAKAEFKVNDIILRAGERDIKEPQDLISAVNEAKEKELVIVALRGGTETTLKVTPARRPKENVELAVSPDTPHAVVVEAIEELHKKAPGGDVRLFAVRPGAVYAYAQAAKFPNNLEISIEKRGDKPATIRVKRIQEGEDKTWEVTEDKLNDLPEDIRGHVLQVLGGHAHGVRQTLQLKMAEAQAAAQDQTAKAQEKVREAQQHLDRTLREYRIQVQPPSAGIRMPVPVAPPAPARHVVVAPHADGNIQAKLDAILKKLDHQQSDVLDRLQKEVERLRRDLEELRQEKK